MKNADRNLTLAAATALVFALAPTALADSTIRLKLPSPPSPREVLRSLPAPPMLHAADRGRGHRDDGGNRGWNDRSRGNERNRGDAGRGGRYDGRDYGRDRYEGDRRDGRRNDRDRYDGRWNDRNRYRDDRYRSYRDNGYRHDVYRGDRHRGGGLRVWVDGRWLLPPFPGAIWIDGYFDDWGDWVPGHWVRAGYGYGY